MFEGMRWPQLLMVPAVLVAPAPWLQAQGAGEETYLGEVGDHYAQVKVVEGEVRILKGDVDEVLGRGVPVAEGDVVESHGRGILQLADGTRIAFGADTRFQVASLFESSQGHRHVLLRLDHGRLRVALGRESDVRLKVDTPAGGGTLGDRSQAGLDVERDATARIRVYVGRMDFATSRGRGVLLAGQGLTVYGIQDACDRVRDFGTYGTDAFETWCEEWLNAPPRPSSDRAPREIRYFCDDLDAHGEWIHVDGYATWCWRPRRVAPDWRPYWRGRWGCYAGGMTWVSDEPWGYVTYHYGRWGWRASLGWYWIPGSAYAPAWVAWQSEDAYLGWAPLDERNAPCTWGYGAWGGGSCWNVVSIHFIASAGIHEHVHSQPEILRAFGRGGDRGLQHPWLASPLLIQRGEFRDPAQMQQFLRRREVVRGRFEAYERQAEGRRFRPGPVPQPPRPPAPNPPAVERPRDLRAPWDVPASRPERPKEERRDPPRSPGRISEEPKPRMERPRPEPPGNVRRDRQPGREASRPSEARREEPPKVREEARSEKSSEPKEAPTRLKSRPLDR